MKTIHKVSEASKKWANKEITAGKYMVSQTSNQFDTEMFKRLCSFTTRKY